MWIRRLLPVMLVVLALAAARTQATTTPIMGGAPGPHITIGTANGNVGDMVHVPIDLMSNGPNIIIILPLQFTFNRDALTFVSCATPLGASYNAQGLLQSPGVVSAGLSSGANLVIPDGPVLTCDFTINPSAATGSSPLQFTSAGLSDDQFNDLVASGTDGAVTVGGGGIPTVSPSPTMTSTTTSTPTTTDTPLQMPTHTETSTPIHTTTGTSTTTSTAAPTAIATVTPTPISCVGNCNGDQAVTVDELLTLVNIALGNADVSTCMNGDTNHDTMITIDEILTAVNNALNGCAVP